MYLFQMIFVSIALLLIVPGPGILMADPSHTLTRSWTYKDLESEGSLDLESREDLDLDLDGINTDDDPELQILDDDVKVVEVRQEDEKMVQVRDAKSGQLRKKRKKKSKWIKMNS